MGGRAHQGHRERSAAPVDLVAIALDDALLDELSAGGLPDRSGDADRLHRMLATWRDDLRLRPVPARPTSTEAARIVADARRHRSSRPMIAVAAAIVALLVGSAIVGSRSAQPGDPLFPVTQALWADRADAAVAGEEVRGALSTAHAALQAGDAQRAADALAAAVDNLPGVRDAATHQAMQDEILHLWTLVVAADPTVSLPAGLVTAGSGLGFGQADGAPAISSAVPAAPTDGSGGGSGAGGGAGGSVSGGSGGSHGSAGAGGSGGDVAGPGVGAVSGNAAVGPDVEASGGRSGGVAENSGSVVLPGGGGGPSVPGVGSSSTPGHGDLGGAGGGFFDGGGSSVPPSSGDLAPVVAPPVTSLAPPVTSVAPATGSTPAPLPSSTVPSESSTPTTSSSVPLIPVAPTSSSTPPAPTTESSTPDPSSSSTTVSTSPGAPPTTASADPDSPTTSQTPDPSSSDTPSTSADPTPTIGDPSTEQETPTTWFLGALMIIPTTTGSSDPDTSDPVPSTDYESVPQTEPAGG